MRIVDADVLVYAVNADTRHHEPSREWLDRALSGGDRVVFAWVALLAFVRLTTKEGLFPSPLSTAEACELVGAWLAAPCAQLVHPGSAHLVVIEDLLARSGTSGNLANDAHLAALAVEKRAEIVTYDRDFGRFDQVRWHRPDELVG